MKKLFVVWLLPVLVFGLLVGGETVTAQANTVVTKQQQIAYLQAEVLRLQQLLLANEEPPKLKIFPIDFEAVYLVQFDQLVRYGHKTKREVDLELFDLLKGVLGTEAVVQTVKEWRVFNDEDSWLGAFVETRPKSKKWAFGVNRSLYEAGNKDAEKLIAELYIHEYSHTLFYPNKKQEEVFAEAFWEKSDYRHSQSVAGLKDDTLFNKLNSYFEKNQSRFVTDYATYSPAEDMAETFVAFVLEDEPIEKNERSEKIRFFYDYNKYTELRQILRKNLEGLGML